MKFTPSRQLSNFLLLNLIKWSEKPEIDKPLRKEMNRVGTKFRGNHAYVNLKQVDLLFLKHFLINCDILLLDMNKRPENDVNVKQLDDLLYELKKMLKTGGIDVLRSNTLNYQTQSTSITTEDNGNQL